MLPVHAEGEEGVLGQWIPQAELCHAEEPGASGHGGTPDCRMSRLPSQTEGLAKGLGDRVGQYFPQIIIAIVFNCCKYF